MRYLPHAVAIALITLCLGYAGTADYQEARAQQQRYCAHVAAGLWPDYLGNYQEECRERYEEVNSEEG